MNQSTSRASTDLAKARQREKDLEDLETLRLAKEQEAERLRIGKIRSKRIGNTTYIASPKKLKEIEHKYQADQVEKLAREARRIAPLKKGVRVRGEDARKRTRLIWERMTTHGETIQEASEALGHLYQSVRDATRVHLGFTSVSEANAEAMKIYKQNNKSKQ